MMIFLLTISLLLSMTIGFFIANYLIKKTNWYRNLTYLCRDVKESKNMSQLDYLNVGSNPARFGFNYEEINGVNLSTGTQGLDYDLKILKAHGKCLKSGGVVIIPLVPFTSISAYLDDKLPVSYHAKFADLLPKEIFENEKIYSVAKRIFKYPLWYNKRAIKRLLRDTPKDDRLNINKSLLNSEAEWEEDAVRWMRCWTDEFNIEDVEAPLSQDMLQYREKSIKYLRELILYIQSMGWEPVVVSPPISQALAHKYNDKVKEVYLDSYMRAIKDMGIKYLDFTYDKNFTNEYFMNALFLNKKGAKLFTRRVLHDLGLINNKDCM